MTRSFIKMKSWNLILSGIGLIGVWAGTFASEGELDFAPRESRSRDALGFQPETDPNQRKLPADTHPRQGYPQDQHLRRWNEPQENNPTRQNPLGPNRLR